MNFAEITPITKYRINIGGKEIDFDTEEEARDYLDEQIDNGLLTAAGEKTK